MEQGTVATRQPHVGQSLSRLEKAVGELNAIVESVEHRFQAVVMAFPEPIQPPMPTEKKEESRVALAEKIDMQTSVVEAATKYLSSIIQRAEL